MLYFVFFCGRRWNRSVIKFLAFMLILTFGCQQLLLFIVKCLKRQQTVLTCLSQTPPLSSCHFVRLCIMTWMLAKVVCGASLIRSLSFCCAALSAARSLPGALLSATGLSDELDSASERRQSELVDNSTNMLKNNKLWRSPTWLSIHAGLMS